jgi:hypothetical protein
MNNIQKAKRALKLIKGINKTLGELYIKHSIDEGMMGNKVMKTTK